MGENENTAGNGETATNADLQRKKLELEIQKAEKELENFGKPPATTPKSWWTIAVEFVALPTAVLGLAATIVTASGNLSTKQKTDLESVQIKTSLAQAAETKKLANDLSVKEKEGTKAFEQAVSQNADKIQSALERLQQLENQAPRIDMQRAVLKFVMIWILFEIVGLIFGILNNAWGTATTALYHGVSTWFLDYRSVNASGVVTMKEQARDRRRRAFNRFAPFGIMVVGLIPRVLRWSIQLSIFAVLLGPLFNEISVSFGSSIKFTDVLAEGKQLHFSAMLNEMQKILFP